MSLLTRKGRITVKKFAAVPTLADLPETQQDSEDTDSISDNTVCQPSKALIV